MIWFSRSKGEFTVSYNWNSITHRYGSNSQNIHAISPILANCLYDKKNAYSNEIKSMNYL